MALTREQKINISKLRELGYGYRAVADNLNISREQVKYFCRINGLAGFVGKENNTGQNALDTFKLNLIKNHDGAFEYISGYSNGESLVTIECIKCGHHFERNATFARRNKKVRCPNCVESRKNSRDQLSIMERSKAKETKKIIRAEVDALKRIAKRHKFYCECKNCGKKYFASFEKKCCSVTCTNKLSNRKKSVVRDYRLRNNGRVDADITIDRIIKRDGICCYICGDECDLNDYIIRGSGTHVSGNMYPSIEHVIPISKGGTHTWDNVLLAHRICNSIKKDKETMEDSGQMIMHV